MPFRRRNYLSKVINSRKNIVQAVVAQAAGNQTTHLLAEEVDSATLAAPASVTVGAKINTVYIEAWFYGAAVDNVNSPIGWGLFKSPGTNLVAPTLSVSGSDDNKKWIFAQGKGLVGNQAAGQPGYLVRGWFSLPKKMRRWGHDDALFLVIENNTANILNICWLAIYKWYI